MIAFILTTIVFCLIKGNLCKIQSYFYLKQIFKPFYKVKFYNSEICNMGRFFFILFEGEFLFKNFKKLINVKGLF